MARLDTLQLFFGDDFRLSDKITIHHPTIGEIVEGGEENYWSAVFGLSAIPSDMISVLWDIGIDWEDCKDLTMFYLMVMQMPPENYRVFFPNLDFSKFRLLVRDDGIYQMVDSENDIVIDEYTQKLISDFICRLHGIKKTPRFAGNSYTKKILINEDRKDRERAKQKEHQSSMLPLISSMVNSPGFKYDLNQVRDMKIFPFMDSVARIQLKDAVDHVSNGYYSGNIDTSKFDTKKLDWMRDLYKA